MATFFDRNHGPGLGQTQKNVVG